MNLKDLKYLVAVAETGHFGRAARRTFVSQPTLSAQLKKLEEHLGVTLIERQPMNIQLTEVGRQIVAHARRMLREEEEIVELAEHHADPFGGKLKMGLIPTIGPYLLPRVMHRLRKSLPHLKLMLYEHQTEPLLERLKEGEIDLAVMALPIGQEGLESRKLYEEPFMVALPDEHPLAAKSTLKVGDLHGHTLLLLEDGHCLREQALELCSRVDVHEAQDFRATSLETLRQMVVAGLGLTLLPALAVDSPFGPQRGLNVRAFAQPAPSRTVGAVWRKSSTRQPAISAVCRVLEHPAQGKR